MRLLTLLTALLLVLLPPPTPQATETADAEEPRCAFYGSEEVCISEASYVADVCRTIGVAAGHYGIPDGFLARLIWQESRFDPLAVSPAGAMGIAQFMASTASLRALDDPFDPAQALLRSAEYLRFLERKFGNLGLAAAAYNGGEGRLGRVVGGSGGVAAETRAFVSIITGRPIEYWLAEEPEPVDYALHPERPFAQACMDMASAVPMPDFGREAGQWQPWGVLIAQNFSPEIVRSAWERARNRHSDVFADHPLLLVTVRNLSMGTRIRHSAQVGFPERQEAESFCAELRADGGNCIVQRNGS